AGDGLQSNEFSEHAVFKNQDGEIIVGGTEGINIFNPENIRTNNIPPKTTITGFYLFNKKVEISEGKKRPVPLRKSIVLTDTIILSPAQSSFAFDFSAMLYSNPGKVNYAYMLEGFDKDWNYTDAKSRNANYTNLRHGKYIFKVKSTNIDGIWDENPRQVFVHIRTPFVYSWAAFVIYILSILLIIIYLTNYSVIKYTTKKKIILENDHNRKLHELDELRNRFFINISHDLRTPLTLISSPLDMVLKEKELPTGVKNHLSLVKQNVKKLIYITEQILDFSKSEAGILSPKKQSGDIVSFIKTEATHFTQAVRNKGLEFYILSNEAEIHTAFDTDMLSKVLFNLISNAIKFTHKGEIKVRIEKTSQELPEILRQSKFNSYIKIEIQDSGEGIGKHELDKIFDRFYQGKDNKEKGFGIGLSHCKDLIEAHEGMIEAFSEKEVGSTIRFFIPYIESDDNIQEEGFTAQKSEDLYVEAVNDIKDDDTIPDNASQKRILLIEDNPDMRSYIRNELKIEFNVFEAKDGIEGLEMAERYSPDLIISDIMMPRLSGLELCKKIKSEIQTSHIPVILLTAKTDTPTKYQGIEMGADDYISKPFEMEYLSLRIKNLLKSREQLQRLFQINSSLDPSVVTVSSLDERFLSQLMKELENGISDPDFTVNSLESKMGMSHSNFYRKIKSLTGQSGKDILLNMRMKRAKQVLTDNKGIRISEVAYMVGYVNPKYFSHNFKDFYGVLPSDIAK
ncbi:MAG: response regulator, partial [Bacteroidales bacterium]|nr:response regulator [Bacteroidales bacterium]